MSRRLSFALAGLLLAGCGSGAPEPPPPDPCPPVCPGSAAPVPAPAGTAPAEGSAAYDALVVSPQDGELARGGNDKDAAVAELALDVVVPAGQRLRSRTVCQGRTTVTLTTEPPSGAESELACGADAPTEVIVEESAVAAQDTAYRVVVQAPPPARWYAVLMAAS